MKQFSFQLATRIEFGNGVAVKVDIAVGGQRTMAGMLKHLAALDPYAASAAENADWLIIGQCRWRGAAALG